MLYPIRYAAPCAVAFAAACLALSVNRENAMADEPKTVTVTEEDNNSTVKLAKGDTLVLRLVEQPGTAFGWKLMHKKEEVLKEQGKVETEKPEKPLPGGKVTKVWRFKAEAAGTAELELHYVRPFDKDKPPAKTFKLKVKAE